MFLRSGFSIEEADRPIILMEEGQSCNYVYFIAKGAVRIYSSRGEKEFNSWILLDNELIVSLDSFSLRTPSVDNLQALKKTLVVGLSYEHMHQLFRDITHSYG